MKSIFKFIVKTIVFLNLIQYFYPIVPLGNFMLILGLHSMNFLKCPLPRKLFSFISISTLLHSSTLLSLHLNISKNGEILN